MQNKCITICIAFLLHVYAVANVDSLCAHIPDTTQRHLEQYWDSGFPTATAQCSANVWSVQRGDAWVWADAIQQPRGRTHPKVFAQLSRLTAGTPVILANVQRSERYLARLGYYELTGETHFSRIFQRNRLVPVIPMRDVFSSRLEAMAAYDGDGDGWSGQIELELKNIAGTARDFRFSGVNNSDRRTGLLYYKEPMLFKTDWDLAINAEAIDEDSLRERSIELEMRYQANFEWQFIAGSGLGTRDWRSYARIHYDSRDRIPMPRNGMITDLGVKALGPRANDTAGQRIWLDANWRQLWTLQPQWVLATALQGAGLLPAWPYDAVYLRRLGGYTDFRALRPYSVYARAYGLGELDLQWRGFVNSVLHAFTQPGVYRNRTPQHGWARVWGYGLGWEQVGKSWSVTLYYTLMQDLKLNEGLLNLSVKTYF